MYLDLLKKYKEQYNFKLFSFVLMPNQLNLLLELKGATTISMIMHDASSAYTKYFNNRYQRKGHLFQERFKSVIAEKGPYLTRLISYTHLSPVFGGLAKKPQDYVYSSHNLYVYNAQDKNAIAQNLRKILDLEKEIEEVSAAIAKEYPDKITYADFIDCISHDEIENLRKKLHRAGILGSEQFIGNVKSQMDNKVSLEVTPEQERKKTAWPSISVAFIVLLSGVGLGIFYMQKIQNAAHKKNTYEAANQTDNKKAANKSAAAAETAVKAAVQLPLVELDGTEWTIEVRSSDKTAPSVYYDKLRFKAGKVSSKDMADKGFQSSNYTLSVQEDGTLSWETMQRNSKGDVVFWRGETTKENKMTGVLNKRPSGGKPEDVFFTSAGFWRKE